MRVYLFNFNFSFLEGVNNSVLKNELLDYNKKSCRDVWRVLRYLKFCIPKQEKENDNFFINNIIKNIMHGLDNSKKKLINEALINDDYKFSAEEPYFYPLRVLQILIENHRIFTKLNLKSADAFYKKYLKYKTKYLELKKIM